MLIMEEVSSERQVSLVVFGPVHVEFNHISSRLGPLNLDRLYVVLVSMHGNVQPYIICFLGQPYLLVNNGIGFFESSLK